MSKVHRHLRAGGFETPEATWIVGAILDHYRGRGRAPTPVAALQDLRDKVNAGKMKPDELAACAQWLAAAKSRPPITSDHAVDLVLKREREDALFGAVEEAGRLLASGKFDEISKVVTRADVIGKVDLEMGVDWGADIDRRTDERIHKVQPRRWGTGIPDLDDLMDGGISSENPLGCLQGGPKSGKCHARGQGILMANGSIKKVEDIHAGEWLMGPDGAPKLVLMTNTGTGEMYEVRPNRREKPWRVNADHILTLIGTGRAGHARHGGEIIDVPVKEWLTWSPKKKHAFKLWKAPVDKFMRSPEENRLPLDPYFLGVLLGDGSLSHGGVGVTTADPEIVEEVRRQALRYGLRVRQAKGKLGAPTYYMSGTMGIKNPIVRVLEALGLRDKTSGDKYIPQKYATADRTARLDLLAGLVDTDGHLTRRGGYEYVSKSRALADGVAFVARSLGLSARVVEIQKSCQGGFTGTYFRLHIYGDTGEIPCRIARKVVKRDPKRLLRRHRSSTRLGFTVVPTGKVEPYFGFTLSGDGRYLLDDFTVTHNSLGLGHIALHSMAIGAQTFYVSVENGKAEVIKRMDAAVAGVPIREVLQRAEEVRQAVAAFKASCRGRLHVQKFPQKTTRPKDIEAYLDILAVEFGFVPQVVLIDYPGEMSPDEEQESRWEALAEIFRSLRAMCERRGFIAWTAAQLKSGGVEKKMAAKGDTGGTIGIEQLVDVLVSIGRTAEEAENGQVRFGITESRFCRDHVTTGAIPSAYEMGRIVAGFLPRPGF